MSKNILYIAAARDLNTQELLPSKKIGVSKDSTDRRISQLNSTKMPIAVELVGAWTFEHTHLDAATVEKAVHYLLSPYNVNGEWFGDPEDDLADRLGRFSEKLGAMPVGNETPQFSKLNTKKQRARERMESVFEPLRPRLDELGTNWEYMMWKVGMDSPIGRLNIEVRANGSLYVRLEAGSSTQEELTGLTGLSDWVIGERKNRRFRTMSPDELIEMLKHSGQSI